MTSDLSYQRAKKKARRLRGFYIHLQVYILVQIALWIPPILGITQGDINSVWGMGLWGLGVLAHGCSIFIPNFVLGKNWEEKKMEQLLNKNQKN